MNRPKAFSPLASIVIAVCIYALGVLVSFIASNVSYGHIPFVQSQFSASGILAAALLGLSSLFSGFFVVALTRSWPFVSALVVGLVIGVFPAMLLQLSPIVGTHMHKPLSGLLILNALGPVIGASLCLFVVKIRTRL